MKKRMFATGGIGDTNSTILLKEGFNADFQDFIKAFAETTPVNKYTKSIDSLAFTNIIVARAPDKYPDDASFHKEKENTLFFDLNLDAKKLRELSKIDRIRYAIDHFTKFIDHMEPIEDFKNKLFAKDLKVFLKNYFTVPAA